MLIDFFFVVNDLDRIRSWIISFFFFCRDNMDDRTFPLLLLRRRLEHHLIHFGVHVFLPMPTLVCRPSLPLTALRL